eukprot:TRINITY_DN642_c0_g2_i1.p1 TRINITY_DN642_c0_g2~~TRINITY_DN642_c0_g2_i1.p1  ORF type:complete len:318 (+),score=84.09 TRINITY_DN642_c0_g2_i1:70-1023(+)
MCSREGRVALGELNPNTLIAGRGRNYAGNKNAFDTPPSKKGRLSLGDVQTPVGSESSSPGSTCEETPAPSTPMDSPFVRRGQVSPVCLEDTSEKCFYLLPPQDPSHYGRLTVVFDLDETLVSNRRPGQAPAIARNYLIHMFQLIKGLVEVVLWTASTEDTGRPVVQQIDPKGEFFHHVIYRNQKWFTDGSHTKDLKLLGRDMDRVLIVENTPNCCKFNPQNAIMVEDFVGDFRSPDRTLLCVATVVRGLAESLKEGGTVPSFLSEHCTSPYSVLDLYQLGLPLAYSCFPEEEAMRRVQMLDPLFRPPLGLYFYVKKN